MLVGLEEVAVAFVRDWNVWGFVIAGAALVLSTGFVFVSVPAFAVLTSSRSSGLRIAGGTGWVVGCIAALGVFLVLPGIIMRRIAEHGNVGWVWLGALVLGLILLYWALSSTMFGYQFERGFGWIRWVPVIALALGTLIGSIVDALNRAASSIPTTVGGLVVLVLIVIGAIVLKARDS